MNKNAVTIIGCGAQAKYVLDIFQRIDQPVASVLDPIGKKVGGTIAGYTIHGLYFDKDGKNERVNITDDIVICLSDNQLKKKYFNQFLTSNRIVSAIHPDSTVSNLARLGRGIIVNARAVIQPMSSIEDGCMVHAGVIVEHDCTIGRFSNLAPGVILSGGVSIGEGTTVFAGAVVKPNVRIGRGATIGAGSLVLHDIPEKALAFGVPAKVSKGA